MFWFPRFLLKLAIQWWFICGDILYNVKFPWVFRKFHHVGLEQLCVARALESLQLDTLVIFLTYNLIFLLNLIWSGGQLRGECESGFGKSWSCVLGDGRLGYCELNIKYVWMWRKNGCLTIVRLSCWIIQPGSTSLDKHFSDLSRWSQHKVLHRDAKSWRCCRYICAIFFSWC